MGEAKEVPLLVPIVPLDVITVAPEPLAIKSGLIRPSLVGPCDENVERIPWESTAPTERIESASAGQLIYFQLLAPSFPAAATTIIPTRAEIFAAREITLVLPSRSEYV